MFVQQLVHADPDEKENTKAPYYTLRIFPPAIDIIPTLLAVVYSNGKYTN